MNTKSGKIKKTLRKALKKLRAWCIRHTNKLRDPLFAKSPSSSTGIEIHQCSDQSSHARSFQDIALGSISLSTYNDLLHDQITALRALYYHHQNVKDSVIQS